MSELKKVEFKSIPNAEDKDKEVYVDGIRSGTIMFGWLRSGGQQWIYSGKYGSSFGEKSLKGLKRKIALRAAADDK